MKVFVALLKNNIRLSIGHKPVLFVITIILPIIILVFASNMITYSASYVNVGMLDYDNSTVSKAVFRIMDNVEGLNIYPVTEKEAEKGMKQNQLNIILLIEKGFEQNIRNESVDGISLEAVDGDNIYSMLNAMLKNHVLNFRNLSRAANGNMDEFYKSLNEYIQSTDIVYRKSLYDLYT